MAKKKGWMDKIAEEGLTPENKMLLAYKLVELKSILSPMPTLLSSLKENHPKEEKRIRRAYERLKTAANNIGGENLIR